MKQDYVITDTGIALKETAEESRIIRQISTREELEEIIDRIPYTQTIQAPNSKVRREFYQTAMEKYEDLEWVKIIKSVYLRMEEKHYEEFESEYLEKAKAYLYGEISIQFQIPFEDVEKFLNDTIEKQLNEF